jgi:type IV secretory pathway TrbF-like protein
MQTTVENGTTERTRRAKRQWDECWNDLLVAKQNWQRIAFAEAVGLLLAIGGLIYLGAQPKQIPYVLQPDKYGNVVQVPAVQPADMDAHTWDTVKIAQLRRFIDSWRTVTTDRTAQANDWDRAFLFVGQSSKAKTDLDQWFAANNPFKRANAGELVTVRHKTWDRQGDHTYGIWWEETTSTLTGQIISTKLWRARLVYDLHIPTTAAGKAENALGLFISELTFEEVQQ